MSLRFLGEYFIFHSVIKKEIVPSIDIEENGR